MTIALACPAVRDLERLALGQLPETEVDQLSQHIMGCSNCARLLDAWQSAHPLAAELRHLGAVLPAVPGADSLVERLVGPGCTSSHILVPNPGVTHATQPSPPPTTSVIPPVVSGYEILGELGRGGMGIVYQARQLALNRTVALKMIRGGSRAGPDELLRFQVEAEAVAELQHPNIVQIYEVGTHAGLPYFSLEYARGGSLAEKLQTGPLSSGDAAQLTETLARAVQHAHEHGILHRDLKPANILLGADGTPKISDFGLARRLQDGRGLTQSGAIVGTPSYMAPEQASGATRQHSTVVDVYALGALLYELLTGRPPFQAATPLETLFQVIGQPPIPPRRVQPNVPRDLETICLKCLAKEPARRYQSAQALADDLRLFQAGQPIRARAVAWPERLVMWARRRPAVAALTAATVMVVLASLVSLTGLYLNAERQRRLAERQEAGAWAITRFFEDNLLAAARPKGLDGGAGYNVSLKEALDRAAPKIDDAFAGQPDREAAVRNTVGMTYWYLGYFESANPHLEAAYRLRRECFGPEHPQTLTSLHNLAKQRYRQDRYPESIALASEALEKRRRVLGPEHPDTLWTQLALAYSHGMYHQHDEALTLIRPAVEIANRTLGPEHSLTLMSQHHLAMTLGTRGQWAQGATILRRVHGGCQRALGDEHPDTIHCLSNLGTCLKHEGDLQNAETLLRQALAAGKRVLGAKHHRILWWQWELADVQIRAGKYAEGEMLLRDGLQACRRQLRVDYLALLGDVLCLSDRPAEAEPLLRECVALRPKVPLADRWEIAEAQSLLGHSLAEQGQFAEAEPLLLAGYEELIGMKDTPARQIRRAVQRLAALYDRWGRPVEAAAWRRKDTEQR